MISGCALLAVSRWAACWSFRLAVVCSVFRTIFGAGWRAACGHAVNRAFAARGCFA
jgi:hypothetical protein